MHASKYGRGTVLETQVRCECYDSKEYEAVPWLETTAVYDEEAGGLTVFAVNRNLDEPLETELRLFDFDACRLIEHIALYHEDLLAVNTAAGETVKPCVQQTGRADGGVITVKLPPASWNVIRIGT
jgi:alpha-N-arabinofuranosidase